MYCNPTTITMRGHYYPLLEDLLGIFTGERSPEPYVVREEIINNSVMTTPTMSEGYIDLLIDYCLTSSR